MHLQELCEQLIAPLRSDHVVVLAGDLRQYSTVLYHSAVSAVLSLHPPLAAAER